MEKDRTNDILLDMDGACNKLKVPKSWLYERCMRKKVPYIKVGRHNRFWNSDLDEWIEDQRVA